MEKENMMSVNREQIKFHVRKMMCDKKASEWCIKLLKEVDTIFDRLQDCINCHMERIILIDDQINSNPKDEDDVLEFQVITEGIYIGHINRLVKSMDELLKKMNLEENIIAEEVMLELIEERRGL